MYKVMIVDDEPVIREGLKTIVPWDEYGFQVAATAANGREALQKFKSGALDLLVIDIRMPGMDGLQLLEAVRKESTAVHVLILSGYADFAYAQKAIAAKVDGYILKPVEETEITQALLNVKKLLDQEAAAARMRERAGWNRELFLRSLLTGENPASGEEIGAIAEQYDLRWKQYRIVLLACEENTPADADAGSGLMTGINELVGANGVAFRAAPYIGLLLKDDLRTELSRKNLYDRLAAAMQEAGCEFVCAAGPGVGSLAEIADAAKVAESLLARRFFYRTDRLLTERDLLPPEQPEATAQPLKIEQAVDKFAFALEIGSAESAQSLVAQWLGQLAANGESEQQIKTAMVQIVTRALEKLASAYPDAQLAKQRLSTELMEVYRCKNIYAVEHFIAVLAKKAIGQITSGSTGSLLKRMVDLIHRNYHENLRLETLAEVFNYNSAYLGKLFKNHTGEYFNTFLDKVRIEQAKKLLEQGYKVYQVAELVGYANADYFHSKFRKYVGVSPTAYRKKE
ncbi:MAG TPA: response regulator transcription factor [Bacilli bacterium]